MLRVAEWKAVGDGHAERLEPLLGGRPRSCESAPGPTRAGRRRSPPTHLSDDGTNDLLELPGVSKLHELAVAVVRGVCVLEEQDRDLEIDLPGCPIVCMRSQLQPPTSGAVTVPLPDALGDLPRSSHHSITAQERPSGCRTAAGRSHADRAAVRQWLPERRRGGHLQIRTVCVASASRPRTSETTAVSVCAPRRLPRVRQVIW